MSGSYLTPLVLAPALIDDPKCKAAGEQALKAELAHMNCTGDMGEFNLLESHWNGTASWAVIKRHVPDPRLRRMARLIQERLWLNRFLTWSPALERITGPGSRMAPSEWLGRDDPWPRFAQSPEFAVGDSGRLAVRGATLQTLPGKTAWLLACEPSGTWVAYQPNPDDALPLTVGCPAGRLVFDSFPFGKVELSRRPDGGVQVDADAESFSGRFEGTVPNLAARINGNPVVVRSTGEGRWAIGGPD